MNKQKIFFQSSLPRTGSTLLQNLIGQNPDFYVSPTSGLSNLILNNLQAFSTIKDFNKYEDYGKAKQAFYNFCKQGIFSFYSTFTSKPYILDKGKEWLIDLASISKIINDYKVIIMVRDLRDILASYEKMYIKDPFHKYKWDQHDDPYLRIDQRFDHYIKLTPLLKSLLTIYNIVNSKFYNNVHIIRYEDLILNPENEIIKIYNYLEVPYFKHNFNRIEQITKENDNFHLFGDHKIRPKLEPPLENYKTIIPDSVSNKLYDDHRWFFEEFNYKK